MVDLAAVGAEVAVRVLKVAAFVALGVGLADLLVSFGVVDRIAGLSRALTGPANLPDPVGPAIVATTASPTAGYGMLAEFRERGALDDRATLVAVTINTFFGFAQHVFTFYAPVLIPILGLRVGLLYVGARGAVALAITLTGVLAGAVLLSPPDDADDVPAPAVAPDGGDGEGDDGGAGGGGDGDGDGDDEEGPPPTTRGKLRSAAGAGRAKVREILPRLAAIYAAVALLTATYDLTRITGAADPLASLIGLPAAAVPVIAVFAIDTTSGAVTLASLPAGTFTPETAVATMLVGGIVSFAVSTFKRSIPFQYGIWGAEFGAKVVAVNTALKVVWIGAALVVLLAG